MSTPGIVLSQLWVYPLKSAAGVALPSAKVALRGLEHDRRWMVVDATGMLVTQRERPELSQVTPSFVGDALHVEAEGMPELTLPLHPASEQETQELTVKMWTEPMSARLIKAATDWFSTFLGGEYRLVYMPDTTLRPSPDHAPSLVSFVDGNPFLVVSEASVADLSGRLEKPVDSLNFRPNLVLSGCEAFAEDTWDSISVGSTRLEPTGPCVRCVMVNVDLASGVVHKEPLRTLARYRRVGNAVHFGQNFRYGVPPEPGAVLTCGDPVTVKRAAYGAA